MRAIVLIVFCILLSGCSILNNLDGLLTLNDYSSEQQQQHALVNKANAAYDRLKADYQAGTLTPSLPSQKIKEKYGEPLLIIPQWNGQYRWLYRYGMWYKGKDKIYLNFDASNALVSIDFVIIEKLGFMKD